MMPTPSGATNPKKGILAEMIKIMTKTSPMTVEEIYNNLKQSDIKVEENSVRSYLSNINNRDYFTNVKKRGNG